MSINLENIINNDVSYKNMKLYDAMDTTIFTICASNYLAQAIVLGESIRINHPNVILKVFLIDSENYTLDYSDIFNVISAEHVLESHEWTHRRCNYNLIEFATSIKPACFRYLFDRGAQRAIYLDPDIQVFQRIDQFWQGHADDAELVLTAHILSPLPDDGLMPNDLSIMRAGLYNLGFAALRNTPGTCALLKWWDTKLHLYCLENVHTGVFTDQKWMDYAPLLLLNSSVLRHLGYNAAYWNLHERIPRRVSDQWCVEGKNSSVEDLIFFHFSGFTPDKSEISRHESRFGDNPPGDTGLLLKNYAAALVNAGFVEFMRLDAPHVKFSDGTTWDPVCRALYRQSLTENLDFRDPLGDPAFLTYAEQHAPNDHVNRYARAILRLRGDVSISYNDGHNLPGLLAWMRHSGTQEMGLDSALVERFGSSSQEPKICVNYVGYLDSYTGLGEAARYSVEALEKSGILVCRHDISFSSTIVKVLPKDNLIEKTPIITLIGCNADRLPYVLADLPPDLLNTYRIGCWYWETPVFPEQWSDRFDLVDEIWAASHFIAEAIRKKATVPVVVLPPMVVTPPAKRDRAWLATLSSEVTFDEFVFLFQFDVASVPFRKNPEGVIAAFVAAFGAHEPVRLMLKVRNSQVAPELMQDLRLAAKGRRISFIDSDLESSDRYRLLASVDSFVSLHRSEGFGLSIAEAMTYGLPVVATGWSGNVDFTTDDNAAVVAYDLVQSDTAHGPYPVGTIWAEPRLDEAARIMRRIWIDVDWRQRLACAGAETIASTLSAEVVGVAMRARIERVARSAKVRSRQQNRMSMLQVTRPRKRNLAAAVVRDVLRFPEYYVVRTIRVPSLVWRYGFYTTFLRLVEVTNSKPDMKTKYRFRISNKFWIGLKSRLRYWRKDIIHNDK